MYSVISFALAGASLLSTVSCAPASYSNAGSSSMMSSRPSGTFTTSTVSASVSSSTATGTAIPFVNDGFPTPNAAQLLAIEELAHGTLPNGTPPPTISPEGITNLQFINFNENFEVAFFSSLIHNISTNAPGFQINDDKEKTFILEVLIAVLAQEELHVINAEKALIHFGQQPILPCKYVFPTTNFNDAIALAATFTDVVLGTLQDVIEIFADNNDNALTRGIAAVIGQEGEQEGFYRLLANKNLIPNELPFLTTSTREFAFSALQAFTVPGSCPNENLINLPIFGVLNLATKNIQPVDQTLTFTFDVKTLPSNTFISATTDLSKFDWTTLTLQYINQQNVPIPEPLTNVRVTGTVVTFDAFFPFVENLMNGLTIGAVTVGSGFATADQVADKTLFAPALIEIN